MSTIEPFIHHKVIVLPQTLTVEQAAHALCERRIGSAVVSDEEGHLTGIVTDRDLLCRTLARGRGGELRLSDAMTSQLVTVDESASVEDVVRLMENYGIRRIPVVQETGGKKQKCIGIVTLDDLIASRSIDHIRLSRIVQSQIFRKRYTAMGKAEKVRARGHAHGRSEETLKKFTRTIASATGLAEDVTAKAEKTILSLLVQRIHFTGAAHLIAQLPRDLQEDLLDLPAGPDRTITAQSMAATLASELGVALNRVPLILFRFWSALNDVGDRNELDHVLDQLPKDIREALTIEPRAGGPGRDQAA